MSFAAQFHVPGAFNFDTSTASQSQALHADVFRPPSPPSTSTYNLAKSTGSLYSDVSMTNTSPTATAKRKRDSAREPTPMEWHMNMEGALDGRDDETNREARYTLAGQISTAPAGAAVDGADNGQLEDSAYSDVDYRRALGPKPEAERPSGRVSNGMQANLPSLSGWSLFSLSTIGDMVGKVWEFCKKGAFRGFHAGGGKGYNVNGSTVTESTGEPLGTEPDSQTQQDQQPEQPERPHSPVDEEPQAYADQPSPTPYSPDDHDFNTPDPIPQPAVKRRQVSANNEELRNWVVVDEPEQKPRRFASEVRAAASRPSGLVRPRSGYYSQAAGGYRRISATSSRFAGGAASRTPLRISHAGSPSLTPREPASFASPRSSPVSRTTASRIPVPVQSSAQQSPNPNPFAVPGTATTTTTTTPTTTKQAATTSPSPSALRTTASRPSSRHSARHSLGSARPLSPTKFSSAVAAASSAATSRRRRSSLHPMVGGADDFGAAVASASPRLDAEARQLAQWRLAAERDADARVDAFNAKLLSMIRQGREALGTRVEVEMLEDGDGGGWEDDD